MMKRFSRRRRGGAGGDDGKKQLIDAAEWLPKLLEQGLVDVKSLEPWADSGVPSGIAAIGQGERADATKVLVAFSPKSATEALLGGLSAAQHAVEKSEFAGELVIVAPQWPASARRLLGLLGRTAYSVESVEAPGLSSGRRTVEAEPRARGLASSSAQLASRMASVEARTAFMRAAIALEGLAAKHGGCVRVGTDRLELVVMARRVAEIRIDGENAVLETQIGGRSTAPLAGTDLATALDGLEGQIRRRLNDRKVREGEEGLRGRVVAQLAAGTELRGVCAWPMPGSDLDVVDAVGVNAEGDPVVVAVREQLDWTALGLVLEALGPLDGLLPVLFADTAPPLRLGGPRLLFAAENFADGLERALAAMTVAYELRKVDGAPGASVNLVSSGGGEGAQSRPSRRGRRRGGRGRSNTGAGEEATSEETPPTGPAADKVASKAAGNAGQSEEPKGPRRGPRSESASDGAPRDEEETDGDAREDGARGRGRGRGRRRSRRGGRGGTADDAPAIPEKAARSGREGEESRGAEATRARRPRFEEVSLMDLDDVPGASDTSSSGGAPESGESSESDAPKRTHRRGRRGGRGESRRGGKGGNGGDADQATEQNTDAILEEDLVDADDLSEILARLTDEESEFEAGESTEESYEDAEEIDEDDSQSARRQARDIRQRSRNDEDTGRPAARGRAAILVHGDRDSLLSAILLARDIRQLEGMWIYPQEELMTFFRSIATDLRDDTPIFVVGFTPSPARDVIQASALYRGRLTWFGRQAWPPEDRVALRESLGSDAVHGGEGLDSILPLVLETCSRRSRFSDKLVDLATGRFTQHDFERWGRLWRWRTGEIAEKAGDIRGDIAALLAGRPSDLAKEAALVDLPPAPDEVGWVAENDFRLVHFGGHAMVVLEVDAASDLHLAARVARERYGATLSLAHTIGEETFVFCGDEINGRRTLDYMAVAEHLTNKLAWVESRPDADHVARFLVRDLERHPERLEEIIGEIAMGRSLLER